MGIFDKIVSKVKSVVRNVVNKQTDDYAEKQSTNYVNRNVETSRQCNPQTCKARFDKIIYGGAFDGYQVKENVSANQAFGASGSYKPYTYCFYSNGDLRACVMLTDHNRDRNGAFLGAKEQCEFNGVPFVNFYTHMANDSDYVVERLNGELS